MDKGLVEKIGKVVTKYRQVQDEIKVIKARHAEELRPLEEVQAKREEVLLGEAGIESFSFFTELFIIDREAKAAAEKLKESFSAHQANVEKWLLKILDSVDGLKGMPTEFGTVYRTKKESVTMAEWDTFLENAVLGDAVEALMREVGVELGYDAIISVLKSHAHFEYLNKAVNKTAALEVMGEADKKGQRPNPPLPGTNYTSIVTVGVRKATK